MKKPVSLLSALLCTLACVAQESYTIRMSVRVEGLPAEYAAYAEQDIVTFIKGKKSKTEVNSMMYSSVVYFNNDSLTMLNDVMGNRSGFVASKSELESDKPAKAPGPQIVYTDESKEIAGYTCKKAIVTQVKIENKKADTMKTIVWVTDRIKTDQTPRHTQQRRGGVDLGDLKGHPLEMEMNHRQDGNDVKVLMTTRSVDTTALSDAVFIPDTKGYNLMGYKEWKASKGKF